MLFVGRGVARRAAATVRVHRLCRARPLQMPRPLDHVASDCHAGSSERGNNDVVIHLIIFIIISSTIGAIIGNNVVVISLIIFIIISSTIGAIIVVTPPENDDDDGPAARV
jgi:hypothetical protein